MMGEVIKKGRAAKAASYILTGVTMDEKNAALRLIAKQIVIDQETILAENKKDIKAGKEKGLTEAVLDRILLTEDRIQAMAEAIEQLVELEDPIGEVLETIQKDNGLFVEKRRVPIGVIGMIYESRPNVTVDAATLTLKAGNAVILRGSSSAIYSNIVLAKSIHRALEQSAVPADAVQLIEDTSRDTAKELFTLNEYLDVLIPRGGENLIKTVIRESTVPVIETGAGNCHLFVDETAAQEMAEAIAINAKVQRPSVCNAIETILVHEKWFNKYGVALLEKLKQHDVKIIGDDKVCKQFPEATLATEDDWYTEYLDLTVSIKVIDSHIEAIEHINKYGTKHSESIVTNDEQHANIFLQNVDATSVYHNASTRFTDGFEFGYGAEMGISTQKLHARGPMGLQALTSTKFVVRGEGQIRQ